MNFNSFIYAILFCFQSRAGNFTAPYAVAANFRVCYASTRDIFASVSGSLPFKRKVWPAELNSLSSLNLFFYYDSVRTLTSLSGFHSV